MSRSIEGRFYVHVQTTSHVIQSGHPHIACIISKPSPEHRTLYHCLKCKGLNTLDWKTFSTVHAWTSLDSEDEYSAQVEETPVTNNSSFLEQPSPGRSHKELPLNVAYAELCRCHARRLHTIRRSILVHFQLNWITTVLPYISLRYYMNFISSMK